MNQYDVDELEGTSSSALSKLGLSTLDEEMLFAPACHERWDQRGSLSLSTRDADLWRYWERTHNSQNAALSKYCGILNFHYSWSGRRFVKRRNARDRASCYWHVWRWQQLSWTNQRMHYFVVTQVLSSIILIRFLCFSLLMQRKKVIKIIIVISTSITSHYTLVSRAHSIWWRSQSDWKN